MSLFFSGCCGRNVFFLEIISSWQGGYLLDTRAKNSKVSAFAIIRIGVVGTLYNMGGVVHS